MNIAPEKRYYAMALTHAKRRELRAAIELARLSLYLDADNENARLLAGLCLYELGELEAAEEALAFDLRLSALVRCDRERTRECLSRVMELAERKKWRKADAALQGIRHQSVRVLIIRGCVRALAGRYEDAAILFARALEKDAGNKAAVRFLAGLDGRSKRIRFPG